MEILRTQWLVNKVANTIKKLHCTRKHFPTWQHHARARPLSAFHPQTTFELFNALSALTDALVTSFLKTFKTQIKILTLCPVDFRCGAKPLSLSSFQSLRLVCCVISWMCWAYAARSRLQYSSFIFSKAKAGTFLGFTGAINPHQWLTVFFFFFMASQHPTLVHCVDNP